MCIRFRKKGLGELFQLNKNGQEKKQQWEVDSGINKIDFSTCHMQRCVFFKYWTLPKRVGPWFSSS